MAQKVVFLDTCDPCDHLGLPDRQADGPTHTLSLDGGPLKEFQFCARCEIAFAPLLAVLREHGQEVEPKVEAPPGAVEKPKAVSRPKKKKPKELEAPSKQKAEEPEVFIICPLDHPSAGGGPLKMKYANRNGHTGQVHPELQQWDIVWGDPDNALVARCTSHAECMKTGLAFTTTHGLGIHKRNCPLPRIDTLESGSDGDTD